MYIYTYTKIICKKIITNKFQTTHTHKSPDTHSYNKKITASEIRNHSNTYTQRKRLIKYQRSMSGKAGYGKHTLRKERSDLHINPLPTENHSNCKYDWVQVSLSTPLTRPCTIYVLWWKPQAGNIHVCKNEINKQINPKRYKSLRGRIHFNIYLSIYSHQQTDCFVVL